MSARCSRKLLDTEGRLLEFETGTGVIQDTLRRALAERDAAQAEATRLAAQVAGDVTPIVVAADEGAATVEVLTAALADTATERDDAAAAAEAVAGERADLENQIHLMQRRNEEIFAQLEEAIDVSVEPLEKMFRSAGLEPGSLIAEVRRGYSGQGGPLEPIAPAEGGAPDADAARANAILKTLDEVNLYRIAAAKAPFANPVPSGAYRQTSGFGTRRDPFGRGSRMHSGLDFAGATGTPIHVTADGTVLRAGWMSGYGKSVDVRHGFGLMTRYAHLNSIDVAKGQSLSHGDRIGGMGSTGRSTGTHLHYEVHVNGAAVNPMNFLKAARDVF